MQSLSKYTVLIGLVLGTITAKAQDVLYAQPVSSITIQNNANVYVQGNITLSNTSTLTNEGRLFINRNTITGVANWLDQTIGSYYYGSGTFIFNSSGTQTATSPNQFGTLEVRNAGLNLGSHIRADRWLLHSGIVTTTNYRAEAMHTDELAVNATLANPNFTQSWFNGTLRRHITPATVNSYLFPVGGALRVNSAQLFNLLANPINANFIDASFKPKLGTDAGLFLTGDGLLYTSMNTGGVWDIVPNVTTLSGNYNLRLDFNGFSGLIDNMFGILRRDTGSISGADWIVPPGSSLPAINQPGRMVTDGFARRNANSIMGQFGIGVASATALPITLIDFNAIRHNNKQAQLSWVTNYEEENEYFIIERKLSTETSFKSIGRIPSSYIGSGFRKYYFNDPNEEVAKTWYRLKLIDQSGNITYSNIRIVNGTDIPEASITIAPNPSKGQFTILVPNGFNTNQGFLYDEKGRLVKSIFIKENIPVQVTGLPAGTYILSIPEMDRKGNTNTKKIVVIQ